MSLRNLPQARALSRAEDIDWAPPSDAVERWARAPLAAAPGENTITIFDVIGKDYWSGEGVTAKRIDAALRSIGDKPVTVKINSPGGDMFEGLAIYNLLVAHPQAVTVEIYGVAASAASIIAMAGDTVSMGLGSFLMIHNAWGLVVGNRNDMRGAADIFEEFDAAMSEIYVARTGQDMKAVAGMMDGETWLRASEAIAKGFADKTFQEPAAEDTAAARTSSARARLDSFLARQNVPRSERRKLLREATGTPGAAGSEAMPGAGLDMAAVRSLIDILKH